MHARCSAVFRRGVVCSGLVLAFGLAGCKQAPELPTVLSPYRIDVQQGNVITQEMLSKLKAGMTRAQVRFVLGSPLVIDPFRTDRWDYVSTYQKQGKAIERRHIVVIFDDDKLVRIEGDVVLSDSSLQPGQPLEKAPGSVPARAVAPAVSVKPVPVAKPSATAAEKSAPAAAATPQVPASQPEAAKSEAAGEARLAEPAKSPSTAVAAEPNKVDAAKKDAPKDKPKQPGFFDRMRDKLGI